jgi:hypothetical protein
MNMTIYTADDEEPSCLKCDNLDASDEYCQKCTNTFWSGYERADCSDDDND